MSNLDLYRLADFEGVEVHTYSLSQNKSSSFMMGGDFYVGIDPAQMETTADERAHLAHELGHCVTGSFYNPYSKLDIRERHERRANVWAYKHIVPIEGIRKCFKQGLTESWQMEEIFDVPAWFIKQAMEYYMRQATT